MNILNGLLFLQKLHHRCSTGFYIGLRKFWNFQSEAKLEQITAIVTTLSVFLFYCSNSKFIFLLSLFNSNWRTTTKIRLFAFFVTLPYRVSCNVNIAININIFHWLTSFDFLHLFRYTLFYGEVKVTEAAIQRWS